jgi:hypothetical protein
VQLGSGSSIGILYRAGQNYVAAGREAPYVIGTTTVWASSIKLTQISPADVAIRPGIFLCGVFTVRSQGAISAEIICTPRVRFLLTTTYAGRTTVSIEAATSQRGDGQMSKTRLDLIVALFQIQNHPIFRTVDIVTSAANPKISDEQVRNHIEGCMRAISRSVEV